MNRIKKLRKREEDYTDPSEYRTGSFSGNHQVPP